VQILFQSWARLKILETMRSSWCSYDTVRLRTTWNNFSFSAQHTTLAQHTTWKEMFEKVDILRWETSAFADTLRVCCADGASAMIRTKKALWIYEKVEQKYLGSYCFLRREKNQTEKKFKIWQFKYISSTVSHIKSRPLRIRNLVLCLTRWGQNTVGVCSIW